MARADKVAAVAELTTRFRESQAAVLTEYRGLTVAEMSQLRAALGANATYAVVKNTLTKIAAREAGLDSLDDLLVGPSGIAFVQGDPVEAAKGLRDFARTHPLLIIKGGVLDGAPLSASELARLADLESREVLLAKLAGAMKASLSGAAALFQAPLAKVARTVEALRAKVEADPASAVSASVETAVDSGPAADSAPDTAATDSTVQDDAAEASTPEASTPEASTPEASTPETSTPATSTEPTDAVVIDTADAGTDSSDTVASE